MRCLIAENRKLKGAKKQKSAEGKQNWPRKNKQLKKKTARKMYTPTDAVKTPPQIRTKDAVEEHHRIRSSDVFLKRPSCFDIVWKLVNGK